MTTTSEPLLIGAVAYTANVVPIWEGIRDYFRETGAEMDFVLYSNYGRQVDALIAGTVDIAWNTNLAWMRTVMQTGGGCRALAMRDTDLGFRTVLVAGKDAGLTTEQDLRGRRLALGSADSAQAAIMPLHYLRRAGIGEGDVELLRINSDIGKHGDTGRSELDGMAAVRDGRADAAAVGISTWEALEREGSAGDLAVFWTSPAYAHCNFTALDSMDAARLDPWVEHLLAMDWDNPEHRRILELEGLRRWVRPDLDGYADLFDAVKEQAISDRWAPGATAAG